MCFVLFCLLLQKNVLKEKKCLCNMFQYYGNFLTNRCLFKKKNKTKTSNLNQNFCSLHFMLLKIVLSDGEESAVLNLISLSFFKLTFINQFYVTCMCLWNKNYKKYPSQYHSLTKNINLPFPKKTTNVKIASTVFILFKMVLNICADS